MQVIQNGSDKVHFAVAFVRSDANGKESASSHRCIVTLKDGHRGVQARSSFAP